MNSKRLLAAALAAISLCFVGSCSSSSSNEPGTGAIVLTDAGLDDLDMFEVDVTGIVFRKASGATVSAMTRTARIDFTELQDVGDLVARVTLEAGYYAGVTMTLDFSSATVYLKDKTTPATVLGADGNPLTGTVDVPIDFSNANRPFVLPRRNHLFMLDLDLNQGVTADDVANTVTFVPVASAEVDPQNPRPIATNGILTSIDATAGTLVLERRDPSGNPISDFTVAAGPFTVFQIDGQVYLGAQNGLGAAQNLTIGQSRVFVQGIVDSLSPVLGAIAVESGAGTFGNGQDWVIGWITGRTGGLGADATLTVMGRSRDDSTGTRIFNTAHTVDVMIGQTKVLRAWAGNSLNTDALNVGQLIVAFGTLTGTSLDATATTGVVRIPLNSVFGIADGPATGNTVTLDVARFGPRDVVGFNFTVAALPEADPTTYTVDVTGLNTTGITTGSKIRAIGYVNQVGVPFDANFKGVTLVNHSSDANLLFTGWVPPVTASSVLQVDSSALLVDPTAAVASFVYDGFSATSLGVSPTPSIQPRFLLGIYRIVQNGGVELHFGFPGFATALQNRLSTSATVLRVGAFGGFDATTQAFSASIVTVVLQ